MKVVFISSGNSVGGISPIVKAQGQTLEDAGVNVQYYTIKGKGIIGYLRSIVPMRKYIMQQKPDVIHAHYSLSAIVASLTFQGPLVVSLMGSDIKVTSIFKTILCLFHKLLWKITIVKSEDMKKSLGIRNVIVIPNGVNTQVFREIDKNECQKELNWNTSNRHILFPSNPERYEKNFPLFQEAIDILKRKDVEVHTMINVPHSKVPILINASDIVVLSSLWEGSPNAIKEAMACNKPIVSTNVGDVKILFDGVQNTFIVSHNANEMAYKIDLALNFEKSRGRDRIFKMGINSNQIAKHLIEIYTQLLDN